LAAVGRQCLVEKIFQVILTSGGKTGQATHIGSADLLGWAVGFRLFWPGKNFPGLSAVIVVTANGGHDFAIWIYSNGAGFPGLRKGVYAPGLDFFTVYDDVAVFVVMVVAVLNGNFLWCHCLALTAVAFDKQG
jgi:hypothetical protein